MCNDLCVDLQTSAQHCGACGNVCPVAQQCVMGRCQPCGTVGLPVCAAGGCVAGLTVCAELCRDTAADGLHCGACGRVCVPGTSCQSGMCRPTTNLFLTITSTFARAPDGSFRAWGGNASGQLGDGTTLPRRTPSATMVPRDAVEVVGGASHSCARLPDGTVSCWGLNNFGQLGVAPAGMVPRPVPAVVAGLSGVVALAAGNAHTCALRGDGTVACWGNNAFGQLGNGDTSHRATPTPATRLSGTFVAIAAGLTHTCARRADGAVLCWGQNQNGQLGSPTLTLTGPIAVPGVVAAELSAGYYNTCARLADGTVRCWGNNTWGQLGDGTNRVAARPAITAMRLGGAAAEIRVGSGFTCARLTTGVVQCAGINAAGALGNGTNTDRAVPGNVAGLSGVTALGVTASPHACARVAGGALRCWGYNREGQVGDGSITNRLVPVNIPGL